MCIKNNNHNNSKDNNDNVNSNSNDSKCHYGQGGKNSKNIE